MTPLILGEFPNTKLQFNATEMGFFKHSPVVQPAKPAESFAAIIKSWKNWGFVHERPAAPGQVAVQPFLVLDDGESITEIDHPALMIPASDWPAYSSERFPAEIRAWQERLDAEASDPA